MIFFWGEYPLMAYHYPLAVHTPQRFELKVRFKCLAPLLEKSHKILTNHFQSGKNRINRKDFIYCKTPIGLEQK